MASESVALPVEGAPAERRRRRRGFLLLFVIWAGLALLTLVTVLAYYVATRRPVTELPVVEQVTRGVPPRYLFFFAGVTDPVGIAVSPDGQRVYVAESGGERLIKVFDRDGRPVGRLAPPDSQAGTRKPSHLAVDATGRLFAVDRLRAAVFTYSPTLQPEGVWRPQLPAEMGTWLPNGVSVGPNGRIYVTEIGQQEHGVLVFAPDGSFVERLSKTSGIPGGLTYPVHAIADDEGRVYISDGNASRLLAVRLSPRRVEAVGTSGEEATGLPAGLAIGGQKLLVADAVNDRVAVFALGDRPQYLHAFGDSGEEVMAFPNAVAVDRAGRVYVADRGNARVQVWSY